MYLLGQLGKSQKEGNADITIDKETKVSNDMRDWSSFRKTSYDNPLLGTTPEESKKEIDDKYREALLSGKVVKFRQEYLADFDAVSDVVFPEFVTEASEINPHPSVVQYDWHPDGGTIFAACDFNYAKPAATIFLQVNSLGDCVVFAESFIPRQTSYMQAQTILEKERALQKRAKEIWKAEGHDPRYFRDVYFKYIIGDISGEQSQLSGRTAFDDFQQVIGVRPVGIKQPRETGCDMIRHRFQFPILDQYGKPLFKEDGTPQTAPKLFITKDCPNLIYALSSAKFRQTKHGMLKDDYDETPGGYEGLLDALRYALVYIFHDKNNFFMVMDGY
jgi:hypothetical protein